VALKKKNLVLHIGLPKTGTTALESGFFPKYSGYAGRFYGLGPNGAAVQQNYFIFTRLQEIYLQFSGALPPSGSGWRDDLSHWVDELVFAEAGLLIISTEALSSWSRGPSMIWPVHYESPEPLGNHPIMFFLSEIRDLLPQNINLTTIVTLRNQSDFLGSLAAQERRERYFDSTNFDRLASHGDAFLDFSYSSSNSR
jgi:hypothetical protein